MRTVRIWMVGLAFLQMFFGCAEDPPPRLTGVHLQQVDTLYRQGIDSIRLVLDSVCAEKQEARLAELVDSLVEVRRSEERKMRERLLSTSKEDE